MESRLSKPETAQGAIGAMLGLSTYLAKSGLDHSLLNLITLRASQINGCAYCIDMHAKDLRAAGETEQRLYLLDAWRESPFYSERERAALAWTEAVTLVREGHVPDEVYEEARRQFSEAELVNLTLAVVAINGWNRFNIAFRNVPGTYQPKAVHTPGRRSGPMKTAATVVQMLIRLTGLILIVLGALFWTGRELFLIPSHVIIGLLFVLLLWAQALMAARAGVSWGTVAAEIAWGVVVLVLGMTQAQLLTGNAHWVIQALHLLIGVGAIGFAERVAGGMKRAKLIEANGTGA